VLCLLGKTPKQESGPYPARFTEHEKVLGDELRSHVDIRITVDDPAELTYFCACAQYQNQGD
jgi:hypothetical protein